MNGPVRGDIIEDRFSHVLADVDRLRRYNGLAVGASGERHGDVEWKLVASGNRECARAFLIPDYLGVLLLRVRVQLVHIKDLPVLWHFSRQDTFVVQLLV